MSWAGRVSSDVRAATGSWVRAAHRSETRSARLGWGHRARRGKWGDTKLRHRFFHCGLRQCLHLPRTESVFELLVRHRGHFHGLLRVNMRQLQALRAQLAQDPELLEQLPPLPEGKRWRVDPWNNFSVDLLAERSHALQIFFHTLLENTALHCHPALLRFIDMFGVETQKVLDDEVGVGSGVSRCGEALCHWLE